MIVTIFPASNGDSFLIEIENTIILIDGGYVNTYMNSLKPKLIALNEEGKKISHLIVTHIDKDHISGIIKLIEENKEGELITIDNVWHNSYRHVKDIDVGFNFNGKPVSELTVNYQLKEEVDDQNKNISAVQGSTLASLLNKYNYNWNLEFNGSAITSEQEEDVLIKDITLKILSPDNDKLKELKKYWKRELYTRGFLTDENLFDFNEDVFEYILSLEKEKKKLAKKDVSSESTFDIEKLLAEPFVEDDRAANGSSISFIIEYGDYKLLFLADAHPSIIVKNLEKYYQEEELPIKFDLIKVSHHGSKNNTNDELLKYIDSENFIFSTNGHGHNHPDKETIARIICRETEFIRNLYFNYPIDMLNGFKNADLMEKFKFKIIEELDNKPTVIKF